MTESNYLSESVIEAAFLLRSLQQLLVKNPDDEQLNKLEERTRKLLVELRQLERHQRDKPVLITN